MKAHIEAEQIQFCGLHQFVLRIVLVVIDFEVDDMRLQCADDRKTGQHQWQIIVVWVKPEISNADRVQQVPLPFGRAPGALEDPCCEHHVSHGDVLAEALN